MLTGTNPNAKNATLGSIVLVVTYKNLLRNKKMNLRILIYSNPLVVDKISKKFLFWKDSGFIFTKNLLSVLPDDWRYYWLIPDNITLEQQEWFNVKPNIKLVPYPYSTSIHQNRYEFYGNVLKKEFPYTKDIDAVINNQPEVTANIKTWLENQRRDQSPIFNFFHWLDCKDSRVFAEELGGYFWRQWDGVLSAEKSYFHNEYAELLFVEMVFENIKNPQGFSTGYFMPPATNYGKKPFPLPENKKVILFNHRLNNTTNWKFFLETTDKLYEQRKDFVVWFTDDADKAKSKMLDRPYIINRSLGDNEYGFLLENSHLSVCTHKGYSTWNMAVIDAINAGCYTIVPATEQLYFEMFGEFDNEMYHMNEPLSLMLCLNNLLNKDKMILKEKVNAIKGHFPYFTTDHLAKIGEDIQDTLLKKIENNHIPAKYSLVKEHILNNKEVLKSDIVNKFWSFHTNSNFQKIRWNLMKDGIIDDISKDVPTYRGG